MRNISLAGMIPGIIQRVTVIAESQLSAEVFVTRRKLVAPLNPAALLAVPNRSARSMTLFVVIWFPAPLTSAKLPVKGRERMGPALPPCQKSRTGIWRLSRALPPWELLTVQRTFQFPDCEGAVH